MQAGFGVGPFAVGLGPKVTVLPVVTGFFDQKSKNNGLSKMCKDSNIGDKCDKAISQFDDEKGLGRVLLQEKTGRWSGPKLLGRCIVSYKCDGDYGDGLTGRQLKML